MKLINCHINYKGQSLTCWSDLRIVFSDLEKLVSQRYRDVDTKEHVCEALYVSEPNSCTLRVNFYVRCGGFIYISEVLTDSQNEILKQRHSYHTDLNSVVEYLVSRYENKRLVKQYYEHLLLPYKSVYLYTNTQSPLYLRRIISKFFLFSKEMVLT